MVHQNTGENVPFSWVIQDKNVHFQKTAIKTLQIKIVFHFFLHKYLKQLQPAQNYQLISI